MKKKIIVFITITAMLFSLCACGTTNSVNPSAENTDTAATGTKTITNVDGTEITVPNKVEKIGCLFGPSYEKVVVLGAEDKIVFDGDFHIDGWPWSNVIYKRLNDVPGIVNAHSEPNIEDLVGYDTDLVFNFPNPETTQAMEDAGMYVVPSAFTGEYDDIVKTMNVYAEAIGGNAPDIAKKYSDYFYEMTNMIAEKVKDVPDADKPVIYFANQEILKCSNKKDLIEWCGGKAAASDLTENSADINKEQLIEWNPDYIFVDHAGSSGNASAEEVVKGMLADADYQNLTAVSKDHVVIVPTGVFFWDSGVQQPLLMLLMAKTMYPDRFADVDMKTELIDFYSEFFNYDLSDEQAEMILAHEDPA